MNVHAWCKRERLDIFYCTEEVAGPMCKLVKRSMFCKWEVGSVRNGIDVELTLDVDGNIAPRGQSLCHKARPIDRIVRYIRLSDRTGLQKVRATFMWS